MLTSDAISFSLAGLAVALGVERQTTSDDLATVSLIGYAFVPPAIHLAHARFGMVPASLAVRVLTPVAGLSLGDTLQACENSERTADIGLCRGPGAGVGMLVGFAIASAVDASLFSWDNPPPPQQDAMSFGVSPILSADGKRAELRAVGRF